MASEHDSCASLKKIGMEFSCPSHQCHQYHQCLPVQECGTVMQQELVGHLLPLSSPSQESFEEKEKGWRVTKFHFQAAQKTRCEQTAPGRRDPAICCCGRRRGRRRARRGQEAPATPQKVSLGTSGEREAPATLREGNVSPDRRLWQPLCR